MYSLKKPLLKTYVDETINRAPSERHISSLGDSLRKQRHTSGTR